MAEPIVTALADLAVKKTVTKGYGVINKYVIDFDSDQEKLQNTMNLIKAALLDGDSMPEQCIDKLTREQLSFLLDEWHDLSDVRGSRELQKQLMSGGNFTKQLLTFFSKSNQFVARFKDARKADNIKKKLSSISINHAMISRISCMTTQQPRSVQRVGSSSNILTNFFVGRVKDRDRILSMLSDDSLASETLSVASIVGIGGMGKTSLAWSVYNDDIMQRCFDVQFWVEMTQDFDVMKVLEQIIPSGAGEMPLNHLCNNLPELYHQFLRAIGGKKFLLVLDNITDETGLRNKWFDLRKLLEFGANGSKVLITTQNLKVAGMMDSVAPYKLGYLTEEDSWLLFKNIAFTPWQEPGVETIGMEIAKMCLNLPLVIRSIAANLAGKHTLQQWHAFKNQLATSASYGHDVMDALRFSYDQLDETDKQCVTYCSLFEKGGDFSIDEMIHRWIALDYIKHTGPTCEIQSLEDAGRECMFSLVHRGFLELNDISDTFRMNAVMYEVVLTVAGSKYKMMESNTVEIDEKVRHLSFWKAITRTSPVSDKGYWEVPSSLFKIKDLQSFVRGSGITIFGSNDKNYNLEVRNLSMCGKLISKYKSLRLLDLDKVGIKELPTSIGDLICLRFLNLFETEIIKIPNSITRLVNLQTLYLNRCKNLEELPRGMSRLENMRHLRLQGSKKLRRMPMGLGNLTNLRTLDTFIVGEQIETKAGRLADLDQLNNLSGRLVIKVWRESKYITLPETGATILKMKDNLRDLSIRFKNGTKEDESVLECLQPPPNLVTLCIDGYGGQRLPGWMMDNLHNRLPSLRMIIITNCKSCKYLCSFGRLPRLKSLILRGLDEVEYVEDMADNDNTEDEMSQAPLFTSLTTLVVEGMPKLKGWWRMSNSEQDSLEDVHVHVQHQHLVNWKPAFPNLHKLEVDSVELAIAIARPQIGNFPSLERLNIKGSRISEQLGEQSREQEANTLPLITCFPNLANLEIIFQRFEVLPEKVRYLSSPQTLKIQGLFKLKAIPEWIDSLTSLQTLELEVCPELESLPHQIINLPNLNTLQISVCPKLREKCQSPNGEYWPFIKHIQNVDIWP